MAEAPYTVTRIADVEPIPALDEPFSIRLVRRELGIHAFGINAYSARKAGDRVIEEHDELGGGAAHHEELYVVTSGRATFTVDGETLDAPTGMLVFVPDTKSRRGAVAAEDDTTVVVVGGTAGAPYQQGGWEWSVTANKAYLAGDYAEAIRVASKGLEQQPRSSGLLYNLACFNALAGDGDEAVALLRRAYEINPDCRTWAEDDADLDSIRGREDWPL
jgi:tetratricopeptide (TPR) repeat protein